MATLLVRRRGTRIAALVACCGWLLFAPGSVPASTGYLDPSFGTGGVVITGGGGAGAMVIQPDGGILVSGGPGFLRFESDGTPDVTFGTAGAATAGVTGPIALQDDGKIVSAAGITFDGGYCCVLAVARYDADGSVDSSFGTGGRFTTSSLGLVGTAAVLVQPDGKIVVVGSAYSPLYAGWVIVRLDSSGNLDESFGTAGMVKRSFGGYADSPGGAVLMPDGKILVAGHGGPSGLILARFEDDGSLDTTFGTGGTVFSNLGPSGNVGGLAIQADGKIVVAGTGGEQIAVARFDADGSPDTCFGTNGAARAWVAGENIESAFGLAIDPRTQKIVLAGRAFRDYKSLFTLVRFYGNGVLDLSFGTNGVPIPRPSTGAPRPARWRSCRTEDPRRRRDRPRHAVPRARHRPLLRRPLRRHEHRRRGARLAPPGDPGRERDARRGHDRIRDPRGGRADDRTGDPAAGDHRGGVARRDDHGAVRRRGPRVRVDFGTDDPAAVGFSPAGSSQLLGLDLTSFGTAVRLEAPGGSTVARSWIGIDPGGAADGGAAGIDIPAGSAGNTIGGTPAANVIGDRDANVVSGNVVGISILGTGATDNVVVGNRIGTDSAGAVAVRNTTGIVIGGGAVDTTVGGTPTGARDLISGNTTGLLVEDAGTTGTIVQANRIGTNAAGTAGLGNGIGVKISSGATGTSVADNLVSGNTAVGISIGGTGTGSNLVTGNYIGTNAAGTAARGNGTHGVVIGDGAGSNTVGGSAEGSRNVISGNGGAGVVVRGAGTSANVVQGNFIGLNADGGALLGNALGVRVESQADSTTVNGNRIGGNIGYGVSIGSGATGTLVQSNRIGTEEQWLTHLPNGGGVGIFGASFNTVGGLDESLGNLIAFNGGPGVTVDATTGPAVGNSILLNRIFDNASTGIVLGAGANHDRPAPTLKPVKHQKLGKKSTIQGSLASAPSTVYRIEMFLSSSCTHGAEFLGGGNLTTNKKGKASFKLVTFNELVKGQAVTSTATNLTTHDTSAFSTCVTVK